MHGDAALAGRQPRLGVARAMRPPTAASASARSSSWYPAAPGELWLDLAIVHGDEVATNRYESVIVQ